MIEEAHFEEIAKRMGLLTSDAIKYSKNGKAEINYEEISLAYEKLTDIPKSIADHFAARTKSLDLSNNCLRDLSFLMNFRDLNSLILDKNSLLDESTLPMLPNLKLFWYVDNKKI